MQPLGILMLDTQFPRPPGDVGNPATYRYPVRLRRVIDATPERVLHERAEGLVEAFREGARELESLGCRAIVTSCGFLALHQARIADAVSIPVGTSALLLIPLIRSLFSPRAKVGILTASAGSLSVDHLAAAGADPDTPVHGMPAQSEFARVIIGNARHGDMARIGDEVVAAAKALRERVPDTGALILECTNMGPYRERIRAACRIPVFDLVDLANLLMQPALRVV